MKYFAVIKRVMELIANILRYLWYVVEEPTPPQNPRLQKRMLSRVTLILKRQIQFMWVCIHEHIEKEKVWKVIHQNNNNSNLKWWDYGWFLCFSLWYVFFMYCTWNWNIRKVIYNAFCVKKIEMNMSEHTEARPLSKMLFQKCALCKLCILKKKMPLCTSQKYLENILTCLWNTS